MTTRMGARMVNPGNGQVVVQQHSTVMCLSDKGTYDIDLIASPSRCEMPPIVSVVHSFDRRRRVWI